VVAAAITDAGRVVVVTSGGATGGASGCCIGIGIVCAAIDADCDDASDGHAVTGIAVCGRFGCATDFTPPGGVHPVEMRFDAGIGGGAALAGGTLIIFVAAPACAITGRGGDSIIRPPDVDRIGVSNGEIFVGESVTTASGLAAIARGLANGMTLGGGVGASARPRSRWSGLGSLRATETTDGIAPSRR
jgi:hypothetical protein